MLCKYCGQLLTGDHCLHCGRTSMEAKITGKRAVIKPETKKVSLATVTPDISKVEKTIEQNKEVEKVDTHKLTKRGIILGSIFLAILLSTFIVWVALTDRGMETFEGIGDKEFNLILMMVLYYVGFIGEVFALRDFIVAYKNCAPEDTKTKKICLNFIIIICATILTAKCLTVMSAFYGRIGRPFYGLL